MRYSIIFSIILGVMWTIGFTGCLDTGAYENAEISAGQEIAFPVINTTLDVGGVLDKIKTGNASLRIGPGGQLTALYTGELISDKSTVIFPPYPGIIDFPLIDTNVLIALPFDPKYQIDEALFGKTNMFFKIKHSKPGKYTLKMKLPQLSKQEATWEQAYEINIVDPAKEVFTVLSTLEGWLMVPDANQIQFVYEAYDSDGNQLVFDYIAMRFDQLVFDYVEGYFSKHAFELKGSEIEVSIFDAWESGGLDFEDPKLWLGVDNSFGFPVRSRINTLFLTTLDGNTFPLESEFVNSGINFDYPTLDEVGSTKFTQFYFDKDNSNIRSLFNQKVIKVTYDIDAIANPDDDQSIKNFVASTSEFAINAAVELPLKASANEFVLIGSSDVNIGEIIDEVSEIEFKIVTTNSFPIDISIQSYFTDTLGTIYDSLFTDPLVMLSPDLNADLQTIGSTELISFEAFDGVRLDNIRSATLLETRVKIDNPENITDNLWIYEDYSIQLKVGAIGKLR